MQVEGDILLPWQVPKCMLQLTAHTLHGRFFLGEGERYWNLCKTSGFGGSS